MEGQARLGILQPFLGEAPEISSTATLPFPQIRGKEGTLNPKVASALVGSLDEVGQDQAPAATRWLVQAWWWSLVGGWHSWTLLGPHILRMPACAKVVCTPRSGTI